jgi:hypothetical protein
MLDLSWAALRVRTPQRFPYRIALAAVLFCTLYWFTPPVEPRFGLCGFRWLTGRPCPLCGLTHAFFALAKGQFREAIGFNALSPLGFLMLFGLFWEIPKQARLWTFGIAAFGVYGLVRIITGA